MSLEATLETYVLGVLYLDCDAVAQLHALNFGGNCLWERRSLYFSVVYYWNPV